MIVVVFVDPNSVVDTGKLSPLTLTPVAEFTAGAVDSGDKVVAAGVTHDQCKSRGRCDG